MKNLRNKVTGFTIIEVMIVLAIAGLIMLIILLAVPALQRNSRNTQRKSDAAHMAGLITEWENNNSGSTFSKINDSASANGPNLANENFAILAKPGASTAVSAYTTAPTPAYDQFFIYTGATCSGNGAVTSGSSGARSFVVLFYVEPSQTLQCVD